MSLFKIDEGLDNAKLFVAFEIGRELFVIRSATEYGSRKKTLIEAFPEKSIRTIYRYIHFYIFVKQYPRFLLSNCLVKDIDDHSKNLCAYLSNPAESSFWCKAVTVHVSSGASAVRDNDNKPIAFSVSINAEKLPDLEKEELDVIDFSYRGANVTVYDKCCDSVALNVGDVVVVKDVCVIDNAQQSQPQPFQQQTSALSPMSSVVKDVNNLNVNTNPPSNTNPFPPPRNGKGKQAKGNTLQAMETVSTDANNTLAETRA